MNAESSSFQLDKEKLYNNIRESTDITLMCGNTKFECHTVFLASRSPVFMAMFNSNMKETITNEVQIDDIKPEVMAEMLLFIYAGKTSNGCMSMDMAKDLFIAADKYQIDPLKNRCENQLVRLLNIDNYHSLLLLGDTYSSSLKKSVMRFVVQNKKRIELDESLVENPSLMMELLNEFANDSGGYFDRNYYCGDEEY